MGVWVVYGCQQFVGLGLGDEDVIGWQVQCCLVGDGDVGWVGFGGGFGFGLGWVFGGFVGRSFGCQYGDVGSECGGGQQVVKNFLYVLFF